ncbi:phosphotransferase family protein [Palleronia caenipelagi]|uniref:Phosphotransferase family protein n=1 Tax=Palleronia caenipelagi TaxID=2489174 RepID=A0A547Q385_9RHOB|nr:phosphotransferase family protein [Palleronia caenipelagi]TRD20830.1 phosphotransferase family protein [Palleronia caenipelagi]
MGVDFETGALARWIEAELGVRGVLSLSRLTGGQSNPTYRMEVGDRSLVLRRKPFGPLLKSAHAVEREFRVQRALQGTDVPVGQVLALCEHPDVIGVPFYVMEHVAGRSFDDPRLPGLTPEARAAIFDQLGKVLAAIHDVDPVTVGLGDYGPDGDYFARQVSRWVKQYRASQIGDLPVMDQLIAWLEANLPPDDGQRGLVHGDYRIDNLIFEADGPQVCAVLDWELSTLGHPFADLAALLMQWRMPPGSEGRGLDGVDREALGLPSDDAFVATYAERRGLLDIPPMNFYLAFAFFRMGAILEGVKRRALDGNASDPERGLKLGRYVPLFAEKGLEAALG